jgi:hypothetical protein
MPESDARVRGKRFLEMRLTNRRCVLLHELGASISLTRPQRSLRRGGRSAHVAILVAEHAMTAGSSSRD